MSVHALLDAPQMSQLFTGTIEEAILRHLEEQTGIGLDTLVILLPEYGWAQIFHAVDRMARDGAIILRRHRSEYTLFSTRFTA